MYTAKVGGKREKGEDWGTNEKRRAGCRTGNCPSDLWICPTKCTHHSSATLCVGYSRQGFLSTNGQRQTLRNEGDRRTPLLQFRKSPIRPAKLAFPNAYFYGELFSACVWYPR